MMSNKRGSRPRWYPSVVGYVTNDGRSRLRRPQWLAAAILMFFLVNYAANLMFFLVNSQSNIWGVFII
ncbi:hypothetical protein EUGRSUZ_L01315 [Eucalyptus grandis]|uniref:Uncharacterized protein n=1 Tax=Eucalyptus grandis TaxID=71139 RepID=A0A058ZTG7_EUCGR|nr:hypothetical protein EUGRSUZ_L01315 [Eucalyptus grandis]